MCWKCFQRLLEPIVAERQQLHMQGVAIPELVQGMQGVKLNQEEQQKDEQAKAGAGPRQLRQQSGGGSSSSGLQTSAAVADQGTRLQSQVEQYVRLRMLTRKDNMLRQHFAALFHGCLSWVQQARMRVCMVSRWLDVQAACPAWFFLGVQSQRHSHSCWWRMCQVCA